MTVLAFPEDATLWHAESRRTVARMAGDAPTVFSNLPPGDYLVSAVADVGPDTITSGDARFLERLRPLAEKVALTDGRPHRST